MANRYYEGPRSDHFDGERFFHPGLPTSDKSLLDVLRWRVDGLAITAIGHASLLIQVGGSNILLDPVWAERASPFGRIGPRRRNAPAVALEDLPPIDSVLITHNHYDHMDVDTIERLWSAHRPAVISPLGNDGVIRRAAPEVEVTTGDWWESFALPRGVRATIVPAYHWSSRGLGDRRMALWGGFVLETAAGVVYCAGDTAYRDGAIFREIGERFGPPAVAILPIGAYAPRWFMDRQHADPEEAVRIALDCGAKQVLGIHWGTFQLTDEPYEEPAERFRDAGRLASLDSREVVALRAGDTWQLR